MNQATMSALYKTLTGLGLEEIDASITGGFSRARRIVGGATGRARKQAKEKRKAKHKKRGVRRRKRNSSGQFIH